MKIELKYKSLQIGIFEVTDEGWWFRYSEEFKSQSKIKPLFDFPSLEKEYFSKKMFMMLKSRIPPKRDSIINTMKAKSINDDEISMLLAFGKKVIQNPFLVEKIH